MCKYLLMGDGIKYPMGKHSPSRMTADLTKFSRHIATSSVES